MPVTTPAIKIDAVKRARRRGGAGRRVATTTPTATPRKLEKPRRLTFVHPYDDPDVIAGQGTIGMEILRQHAQRADPRRVLSPSAAAA